MVARIARNGNGCTHSEFFDVEEAAFGQRAVREKIPRDAQSKLQMTPERRFIVRPQITTSNSSICSVSTFNAKPEGPCVAGILDRFTSLCLGSPPAEVSIKSAKGHQRRQDTRESSRKRVVYPIVGFPVHLNSKQLVDQRRKSLQHQFFRPVSEDEMSRSVRPRTK